MNPAPAPAPIPQLADKQPVWKISPGGDNRYINSVAVSADGGRVVGGTFYHHYSAGESRRGPAAPTPVPPPPNPSSETGVFGVYCYNAAGERQWADEFTGWQGVYWVAISADGARAAAGGFMSESAPQGFLRIYDADHGEVLLKHRTEKRVNQVALSGDGTWVVSAAETLLLFRRGTGPNETPYVQSDEFQPGNGNSIVSTAISADGGTVVYADYNGHIGVFTNDAGKLLLRAQWKLPGGKIEDFCHMIELTPDGKTFVAGGANGTFYYSDVAQFIATGQPTWTDTTNVRGAVYGVAISGDGSLFAGVLNNGASGEAWVNPRPGAGGAIARHFTFEHNPNSAALSAAHRLFAVADGHPDGTPGCFYLFDPITGAPRWKCPTGNMSWPIVIAANGSAVVGGSDDTFIYYFTP